LRPVFMEALFLGFGRGVMSETLINCFLWTKFRDVLPELGMRLTR
jgi:hypothetical protein